MSAHSAAVLDSFQGEQPQVVQELIVRSPRSSVIGSLVAFPDLTFDQDASMMWLE